MTLTKLINKLTCDEITAVSGGYDNDPDNCTNLKRPDVIRDCEGEILNHDGLYCYREANCNHTAYYECLSREQKKEHLMCFVAMCFVGVYSLFRYSR